MKKDLFQTQNIFDLPDLQSGSLYSPDLKSGLSTQESINCPDLQKTLYFQSQKVKQIKKTGFIEKYYYIFAKIDNYIVMCVNLMMFNNLVSGFSILGTIISIITLWHVGSIKKHQKTYKKDVLFYNVIMEYLLNIEQNNDAFRQAIADSDIQRIRSSLSSAHTILETIEEMIPDKHERHQDCCKRIMDSINEMKDKTYIENLSFIQKLDLFHICDEIDALIYKLRAAWDMKSFILIN